MTDSLTVYVVRNAEGEWMRSVGYGGGGRSWVEDVAHAKLYTKLSQARGRVTYWANAYPKGKPPVIVAFKMSLTDAVVMAEEDRVAAAKMKKATEKAETERRDAKRRLEAAKATIAKAEAEIQRLRGSVDTAICGVQSGPWDDDDPPVTCSKPPAHFGDHAGGTRCGTIEWPRSTDSGSTGAGKDNG